MASNLVELLLNSRQCGFTDCALNHYTIGSIGCFSGFAFWNLKIHSFSKKIYPSIRIFSNESVLCIRWPKY